MTMQIEMRPIGSIQPYERNPRINTDAVDAVAESIRQFGFRVPIVVDEAGVIIAGHTRLLAAQKLGLTEVPVHTATGLTPEQVKAYRIADNKLHELSRWDMELLPIELSELQGGDIQLDLLGFSSQELEKLLGAGIYGTAGLTDPDEIPEPPDEAITKPGDLWILGDHRLLCGDSSKSEDVDRLLDGAVIDMLYCEPLRVRWLCRSCHRRWDKQNPKHATVIVYRKTGDSRSVPYRHNPNKEFHE